MLGPSQLLFQRSQSSRERQACCVAGDGNSVHPAAREPAVELVEEAPRSLPELWYVRADQPQVSLELHTMETGERLVSYDGRRLKAPGNISGTQARRLQALTPSSSTPIPTSHPGSTRSPRSATLKCSFTCPASHGESQPRSMRRTEPPAGACAIRVG